MQKGKIFAFVGMALVGVGLLVATQTNAQSLSPFQCGQLGSSSDSLKSSDTNAIFYVSAGQNRIGKLYNGVLTHDSYTSTNGVGNSVPSQTIMLSSGNSVNTLDVWLTCADGRRVRVYVPSRGSGSYWWLYVAADGSTYNGGSGNSPSISESAAFATANIARTNDGAGVTPEPPIPDTTPPTISAISTTNIFQTAASILWTTNENSDTQVEFGPTISYGSLSTLDAGMVTNHAVNLTGLTAGTMYYYRVKSKDAAGNLGTSTGSFSTAAATTYSFTWTLITPAGTVETRTGNKALTTMKLRNTGNMDTTYTASCAPATGTFTAPEAWNGSTLIAANMEKQFIYSIDVGAMSAGTLTVTCTANRSGAAAADAKTVTDTVTLIAPTATSTGTADSAIVLNSQTNLGANKYTFTISDPQGLKTYSLNKANSYNVYDYTPTGCPTTQTSGIITLESADFPLQASVTDCRTGAAAYTFSIPAPGGTTPPGGTTTPPSNQNWVQHTWTFSDGTSQSYILNRTDREYLDFIASLDTTCRSISKTKFSWKSGAGDDSATNWRNFGIPDCSGTAPVPPTPPTPPGPSDMYSCPKNTPTPSSGWTSKCGEPDTYTDIDEKTGSGFWCAGGGMAFFSKTKAYCPPKRTSTGNNWTMWTGPEIRAVLNRLGAEWHLCNPYMYTGSATGSTTYSSKCYEPTETIPAGNGGWCAWNPPNSTNAYGSGSEARTCPSLDDSTIIPPPPVCPAVAASKCQADEKPGVDANGCYTGVCTKKPICPAVTATVCPSGEEHGPSVADSNGCYLPGPCRKKIICPLAPSFSSCPAGQILKTTTGDCPMTYCVNENEMRECAAGEVSSPNNMCMWPMYRWIYADKQFEKCSRNSDPRIMGAVGASTTASTTTAPMRPGTSCQPMNYELELKWKIMKYTVHPPEKEGEYWPSWDASFDRFQYNPKSDQLEACSARQTPYMIGPMTADNWTSPCQPILPQDKGWVLEKARAEYKMFLLYNDQWKKQPGPGPEPVPVPQPLPIPAPDPGQCRPYLNGVRKGLVDDKQFWRDVNRKFADVKSTYVDAVKVSDLLAKAKALIISIDATAKKGNCTIVFQKIPTDLETLHADIFSDLSGYLTDMEEIGDLAQCRNRVKGLAKEVNQMMVDADDNETQAAIKDLAARIEEKIQGFEEMGDELGFDAGFDCENFADEIDSQLNSFRIKLNEDTGRVSQSVLEKLGAKVETLTNDLADKQKKMDELLVQVADLQKQMETFSKVAAEVSDKLVVSYKALADMGDRFKEDRQQILAEKNKLASLVEETLGVMHDTSCVRAVERDQMARELGDIATINWVPGRGEQLEKRLQLIISSCRANDLTQQDRASLSASLIEAEKANLAESCRLGFTPFCDVATDKWYYGGMVNAYNNGWMIKGMPGESALAQDALLMVLRAGGATESDVTGNCTLSAPEVNTVSPYAVCAVNYAHGKGLPLQGDMTRPVERIRIAQWITSLKPNLPKRADEAVDFDSFADIRSLGNDARFAAYMYANGIMNGRVLPDGKTRHWDPHTPLTRAMLAVILGQLRTVSGGGNEPG